MQLVKKKGKDKRGLQEGPVGRVDELPLGRSVYCNLP